MKTLVKSTRILLGLIVCLLVASSSPAQIRPSEPRSLEDLIRSLSSDNESARQEAIQYIHDKVPADVRGPQLEQAVVAELERLNRLARTRRETVRAGGKLEDDFPAEYYANVIEIVSESSTPIGINALAGALGTGGMVQRALAKFGNDAVPVVVGVARARSGPIIGGAPGDTPPDVIADALKTLGILLKQSPERLSAVSRATIKTVALERLAGRQHPMIVIAACDLAIATRDPDLRSRVEQLALNRDEIAKLGISDPRWTDQIQANARKLAGVQ